MEDDAEKKLKSLNFDFDKIEAIMDGLIKKIGVPSNENQPAKNSIVGFSVKIDNAGNAKIEDLASQSTAINFGDAKKEPLLEIIESENEIIVVAEIPENAKLESVKTRIEREKILAISVDFPENPYYKVIELPKKAKPETKREKLNNGILEISVGIKK